LHFLQKFFNFGNFYIKIIFFKFYTKSAILKKDNSFSYVRSTLKYFLDVGSSRNCWREFIYGNQ
jgi:hypothetical protein